MRLKLLYLLSSIIFIGISFVMGYHFGNKYNNTKVDKYYSALQYENIASEIKSQVKILRLLKNMEYGKAQKLMDNLLDVNLATLGAYGEIPKTERKDEILSAIEDVKEYRSKYEYQVNPSLKDSVESAMRLAD